MAAKNKPKKDSKGDKEPGKNIPKDDKAKEEAKVSRSGEAVQKPSCS